MLSEHLYLLQEPTWLQHFVNALKSSKLEGKTVAILDAGIGILALVAAKSGAKKVYAIESGPLAKTISVLIESNGLATANIVVMRNIEEIKEKVDIIAIMPLGTLGLHGHGLSRLINARDKCLKPNGLIIPNSLKLMVSPVTDEGSFAYLKDQAEFWGDRNFFGVDLSSEKNTAVLQHYAQTLTGKIDANSLMSSAPTMLEFDLKTIALDAIENFSIPFDFNAVRNGEVHGLAAWFELQVFTHDQVFLSSSIMSGPSTEESQWYTCRYIMPKPLLVTANAKVSGEIKFSGNGNDSYNAVVNMTSDDGVRISHAFPMSHFIAHAMGMPTNVTPADGWHVCDNYSNNVGPISKTQLRRLSGNGSINKGSLVWQEGMRDWTPLGEVAELGDL